MHILNNFSTNTNYTYRNNRQPANNITKTTNPPTSNHSNISFCGDSNYLILKLLRESSKTKPESIQKTEKKETSSPRKIEASKMDLKALDSRLKNSVDVKINGNKVELTNLYKNDKTGIAEIPEEYFDSCETDKDKEYLVKKWLVESRDDYNTENIPFELMKTADNIKFYRVDNHRAQMEFDEQARAKGIIINSVEKEDNDFFMDSLVNMSVDGEPFNIKIKTGCKKYDFICAAATYDEENSFASSSLKQIFRNIKDSHQAQVYRMGNKEYIIPKLLKNEPNIKNEALIRNGNTEFNPIYVNGAFDEFVGKKVDDKDIKAIAYINKDSFPTGDRQIAYSYYDDETDTKYLYLPDKKIMMQQTGNGKINTTKLYDN